jgi:hypothetical protein
VAISVHVAGLATIKMTLGEDSGLQVFGYTQDGANLTFQPFFQDVPGDENGGDAGPPIEKVWMGEIVQIQLDFTKWDYVLESILKKRMRDPTGLLTVGKPISAGTLTFPNAFTLIISAPTRIYNFPRCVPESAFQLNVGTKFSRLSSAFTAYKNTNGVLWTETETVLVP